ncbi:hypothetical protein [Mycolicibacterium sp. S3B2]|uniref:hypothetical protein n=1 Tax=Mycolicibacterium sp. S3B2 TaxID=3415120 RepID=UPI003C7E4B93
MAEDSNVVGRYGQGALPGRAVQQAIEEAQQELASDAAALSELGITEEQVRGLRFEVEEQSGIDPATILITILVGVVTNIGTDVGTHVAKKTWSAVLDRLRKRNGEDALGDEEPNSDDAGS